MSCFKLKSVVLFLKILISLVLSRNIGNIIHDIALQIRITAQQLIVSPDQTQGQIRRFHPFHLHLHPHPPCRPAT